MEIKWPNICELENWFLETIDIDYQVETAGEDSGLRSAIETARDEIMRYQPSAVDELSASDWSE